MNVVYHLPNNLVYRLHSNDFEGFEKQLVVKFLKLIYKNESDFQLLFLSKIDSISDLEKIKIKLENSFKTSEELTEIEVNDLPNWQMKELAMKELLNTKETVHKKSFFDNYVSKIKSYLEQNESESIPFLVDDNKEGLTVIDTIEVFELKSESSDIKFSIPNIITLLLDHNIKTLICENKCNIQNIELNDDLEKLIINGNKVESIHLNKKLKVLEIAGNKLQRLQCNPKLEHAFVTNNNLEFLECGENLKELICNGNQLTELKPNKKLKELYAMQNKLQKIECNEELQKLQLQGNPLKYIKLNKQLTHLELDYTPELIIDNSVQNKSVQISYYIN